MKLVTLTVAVAAACVFVQTAQARGYHHHRYGHRYHASRHALSERFMERSGDYSGQAAAGQGWSNDWDQGWNQGWRHGRSDASEERYRVRIARHRYSGQDFRDADTGFSGRRRFYRHRRNGRYAERGEGRDYSRFAERSNSRGGYGARPAAWCGWEMRHLVGSDPGPRYNLARNWAHWGHSGRAGVGAVVVWPHHVGKIVGRAGNGQWVIKSGNDGHRLRTRPRSIGGAIAIRWG